MTQEKYFCDKCKKEVKKSSDLFGIRVNVETRYLVNKFEGLSKRLDLCEECGKKLDILHRRPETPAEEKKVDSIEDRLYDIVADLVEDALANQ